MLRRVVSAFVLGSLLQTTVGCTGKYWKDPDEVLTSERARQKGIEVVRVTKGPDTTQFTGRTVYNAYSGTITGIDSLGRVTIVKPKDLDSAIIRETNPTHSSKEQQVSRRQLAGRLGAALPDRVYAVKVKTDASVTEVAFTNGSGRLWLFDSTLTGLTKSGDGIRYKWHQIDQLKVKRISKTKTILLASPVIALVTLGVVAAIFDWHPMEMR